jgi:eukaryotic-like serine/threonine-protein kinase
MPARACAASEAAGYSAEELEVERSVRGRLYGEHVEVRAIPALRAGRRGAGRPGRLVGGRYRLLECVGTGGMASVYRARDERLGRAVAVKLIAERLARDPMSVRRFRREAELCARLWHPNIVAVLDAGVEPRDFIVLELVDGVDAASVLRGRGRLTAGESVHVVAQVCEALGHAHERGVVHRDVSPANILIGRPDLRAKLADFGLAADALNAPPRPVANVIGTPGYVAPELLRGAGPSPRSDLYSLAVVAYRLLTRQSRPRPADPYATAPMASAAPRMPALAEARPDLPRSLNETVQQALAHEPDARQDSVAEFRAQLVDRQRPPLRLQTNTQPLPKPVRAELPSAA